MTIKERCKECGRIFTKRTPNHCFCSKKCNKRFHGKLETQRRRVRNKPTECALETCKRIFTPVNRLQKYCSTRCYQIHWRNQKRIERALAPKIPEFAVCHCGRRFEKTKHNKVHCSVECSVKAFTRRKRERRIASKTCICGKPIKPNPRTNRTPGYCSEACRRSVKTKKEIPKRPGVASVEAVCPGCGARHKTRMFWVGKGAPRVFCPQCKNTDNYRDGTLEDMMGCAMLR